jgi:predicted nucleic acid-binding protein
MFPSTTTTISLRVRRGVTVFVDTSALYGVLDDTDPHHTRLAHELRALKGRRLLTHNYVVVESATLVRRRLGAALTRRVFHDLLAPLQLVWVDESIHRAAVSAFVASGANRPSLVDFTSFEVMRLRGIQLALAADRDFADAGFEVVSG